MVSGRDYYAELFSKQLDAEAQWLAYGAREKANSIELLLKSRVSSPAVLVELGAGTGAIVEELQRRCFAQNYIAVDYSPDACKYMDEHLSDVEVRHADITRQEISGKVDVVVLSHVLEHLEQPDSLLSGVVTNVDFDWPVIECPLEDLIASRIKNLFRDRRVNLAGHVQFFTAASMRTLVARHLEIVACRHYAPWAPSNVVTFIAKKDGLSAPRALLKHLTMGFLPRFLAPVWKHIWIGNLSLLCRKKG